MEPWCWLVGDHYSKGNEKSEKPQYSFATPTEARSTPTLMLSLPHPKPLSGRHFIEAREALLAPPQRYQ